MTADAGQAEIQRAEEFVVEAREHLAAIEESLLALEKQPTDADAFDRCFRSVHSIKGDAGFLGLSTIRDLAHAMESLLSASSRPVPMRNVELLLAARDRLAVLVDDPSRSPMIGVGDLPDRLLRAARPEATVEASSVPFESDLSAVHGGLADFIRQTQTQRSIEQGSLECHSCDLRDGLPRGSIRWTGRAALSAPPTQTAVASPVRRAIPLNVDLGSVAGESVVGWFRKASALGPIAVEELTLPPIDLRDRLPSGSMTWRGSIESALSPQQLHAELGLAHEAETPAAVADTPVSERIATPPSTTIASAPTNSAPTPRASTPASATSQHAADADKSSTIRIQVEVLDRLMTLVGELTLVRNQSLLAFAEMDGQHRAIIQRLNSVTSELQDATLRARMQPVGNLFNRFPRMVRDLARQLGKQVEIELQGREVELDKTILEQLSDPLMHLVRNSVDHGIESAEARIAAGKPAAGRIVLSATHDDGQVHIQIRDDGKGIDPAAVREKALSLRLKTEAELDRMLHRELFSLILLPGFSTARAVTEVSGRGVGMDVVKTNIEQLEGTLSIDSVPGHGCSTTLRLPLTLAIIPCLIVTVDGQRFAAPQRDLEEVVCLHPNSPGRIEAAFDSEVYRLRNRLLPIVRLSEVLRRRRSFSADDKAAILHDHADDRTGRRIEYILVLKAAGERFGLVVDEVRGTEEIVVKPLHPSMKRVGIFTGATIMGDGRVALITDAEGIAQHAQLSFHAAVEAAPKTASARDAAQVHRVLLFEYGPQEQFALPLIQIRRIEMITPNRIERVGEQEFVSVDGASTRVLRLAEMLNTSKPDEAASQYSLILPKFVSQPMGILVSHIIDTESLSLDLQQHVGMNDGVLGSAIVRNRLTLFLDLHRLASKLFGVAIEPKAKTTGNAARGRRRVLLIDDTAFFREVVKRYLAAEGHDVETAIHGEDGLTRLANDGPFDLVVSDIEMPVMDGWEFARETRRRGHNVPLLALTSLSGPEYEIRAKECGYNDFEVKIDHVRLVGKVERLLNVAEARP